MYLLPALQRVIYNPLDKPENAGLTDLSARELAVLLPLVACIVWLGVYPAPLLRRMEPSAQRFIETVRPAAGAAAAAAAAARRNSVFRPSTPPAPASRPGRSPPSSCAPPPPVAGTRSCT